MGSQGELVLMQLTQFFTTRDDRFHVLAGFATARKHSALKLNE
jgi:hypothetical protein